MALYQCEGCGSGFLIDEYKVCPMCKTAPSPSAVDRLADPPTRAFSDPAVGLFAEQQARAIRERGSGMSRCSNCGRAYRTDLLIECPRCAASNLVASENLKVDRKTTKTASGIVRCGECGREYRADILARCPRCQSNNGFEVIDSGMWNERARPLAARSETTVRMSRDEPMISGTTHLIAPKKARLSAVALSLLLVVVIGFALSQFGILKLQLPNWGGTNQTGSAEIQDGGSGDISPEPPTTVQDEVPAENVNVYNEDDSYEEEVTPQQPSGHYEQRCMRTYQSGGYDQFGNFIDGQWVEQCRDVWVQD